MNVRIYCVGGAVRDALLGRQNEDTDFVVLGCTQERFARSFPRAKRVGQDHPVFILDGRQYTVSSAAHIDQDLLERDLTINALALDEDGYLYAHPLAVADLARRRLRPVRSQNFFADPLRALRAARFKACLPGFCLLPELRQLMSQIASAGLLSRASPERVGREVRLACQGRIPGHFVRSLAAASGLRPWLAEVEGGDWKLTARIMDQLAGNEQQVWMALASSVNSPWGTQGAGHAPDTAAGALAEGLGRRLRLPKQLIAAGRTAATWCRIGGNYNQLQPSQRVELLLSLQARNIMDDFWTLIRAGTGNDLRLQAQTDLQAIQAVRLPPSQRNQGRRSGEYLHFLRCRALNQ